MPQKWPQMMPQMKHQTCPRWCPRHVHTIQVEGLHLWEVYDCCHVVGCTINILSLSESLLSFASCSLVRQSEFENAMVFSGAPQPSEILVEVYYRVFCQPQPASQHCQPLQCNALKGAQGHGELLVKLGLLKNIWSHFFLCKTEF